jgi:hypothetical protein
MSATTIGTKSGGDNSSALSADYDPVSVRLMAFALASYPRIFH